MATRVEPFDDEWHDLVLSDYAAASVFSDESGRESAVAECEHLINRGGQLFARMIALPAQTQAGRAAKVRTFLAFVANDDWRGPSRNLDWEIDAARKLLGEFAGMSEEELAMSNLAPRRTLDVSWRLAKLYAARLIAWLVKRARL